MTHIASKASDDEAPTLRAAIGLAPQTRSASEQIEQGRRIPPPLAASMKEPASLAWPYRARGVVPN